MDTFEEFIKNNDAEVLFEMANLVNRNTGLPFVVWISPKAGNSHDVRIKVSKGPKIIPSELVNIAIRPEVKVLNGNMTGSDLKLLKTWVILNMDTIVKYWDGKIEATDEAIAAIKKI
jgi:hypothetical protein